MSAVQVRVRAAARDYALPVEAVVEVAEMGEITPVPGAPRAVLGVRNLRGRLIAVLDLARALGLEGDGELRRIVVAQDGERHAGLAVEEVLEVVADEAPIPVVDVQAVFDSVAPAPA